MERRTFIRALIGVSIGIPIAVEGITFSTLFYERLVGSEQSDRDGSGVGVGDELLAASSPTDTITEMNLTAASESEWTFTLSVAVENTAEDPYRLKIGPVSLGDGSTVGETVSSGTLDPGASTTVTGEWTVPSNAVVDGIWVGGKTGSTSKTELVHLEHVEPPT